MKGGLVDSKMRSYSGYFDWTLPTELSERRTSHDGPDTGACLIVVSLLSLGIWAAIWGAVASLSAAVLR
jgi:hypothetical protein